MYSVPKLCDSLHPLTVHNRLGLLCQSCCIACCHFFHCLLHALLLECLVAMTFRCLCVEVRLFACSSVALFLSNIKASAVIVSVIAVFVACSDAFLKVATPTGVELHEKGATLGDVAMLKQKIPHGIFVGLKVWLCVAIVHVRARGIEPRLSGL